MGAGDKRSLFAEKQRGVHDHIIVMLKGHVNEANFLFFCRNWFLIDPLHYLSSRSNFGLEFAEIFVIEKRLGESARQRKVESVTAK